MNDKVKVWHKENKMPKNPSLDERITWAIGHGGNCACRPIPESLLVEIKKRKLTVPKIK
jgi:hypothetical protein